MDLLNFIVAMLLGALIGLQREYIQQKFNIKRFAGLRTFILISLLGALLGYLSLNVFHNYTIVIAGFVAITIIALASYSFTYLKYKATSATTELASILTFVIGLMCTVGFMKYAVVFGILIAVLLTFKQGLHGFASKIKNKELLAIVEFALILLVILPLLPNKEFSPLDIPILKDVLLALSIPENMLAQLNVFNPYNIWLMVILVAGISFLGYVLIKFLGTRKGYGLTGLVGGLVSSTAVTISMAEESLKNKKVLNPFVIATVIASSTAFIRILVEVIVVNNSLTKLVLIPLGIMGLAGYGIAFVLYTRDNKKRKAKELELKQPFNIRLALKFGIFFAFVIFIAKLAQITLGSIGVYLASIFSGLADVDAITLTMSSLSKLGEISPKVAVTAIILAASSNTLAKAGMAWFFGEKRFAKHITVISVVILALGLGAVYLLF
ncbi:MAG: MgtC/SapB family protein [archaeon]